LGQPGCGRHAKDLSQRGVLGERHRLYRAGLRADEAAVGPVHVAAAQHDRPASEAAEDLQQAEGVGLEAGDHVDDHLGLEPPQP
jgi:hypothetical protein